LITHLSTPVSKEEIIKLKVGDMVYLSGKIITARDRAHMRAKEYIRIDKKVPNEFENSVVYHCGPIVKKKNGNWKVISAGPTTSYRMESLEHELIQRFGIKMIIGKGGMGEKTAKALKEFKSVYCSFTGGTGAYVTQNIKKILNVEWLDLGTPEAVWIFEVLDFGPLVVSMDSHGGNLYNEVNKKVIQNYQMILESTNKY